MVEQIFLSPQVKRSVIISNEVAYASCLKSCELSNDLGLRILGNSEISEKSQNLIELFPSAYSSTRNKNLHWQKSPEKQNLNVSRSAPFYMKTRVCLKYFVNDCRYAPRSTRCDGRGCINLIYKKYLKSLARSQ